jgi:indolepyruvate ferredoxin oxidoreductase, beta subunit
VKEFNIVLAGVGGQGTLLAAEALGTAAVKDGLNVRVGEIHGMAQRGGAVISTVRIGQSVFASTVLEGRADIIVGFEPIETLRSLKYASGGTCVIMSTERIPPVELTVKKAGYPSIDGIVEKIRRFTDKVIVVDAVRLAKEAGSGLTRNVVLLGVAAGTGRLPVTKDSLLKAVRELVPSKHLEVNLRAFDLGFDTVFRKRVSS